MNRNTLEEREYLLRGFPLFSASVIASVQAYRIRFVFVSYWIPLWNVLPGSLLSIGSGHLGGVLLPVMYRVGLLDYDERRSRRTRQRDRGDLYIYMKLSQCNGTLLLFRPDPFPVDTVDLCVLYC